MAERTSVAEPGSLTRPSPTDVGAAADSSRCFVLGTDPMVSRSRPASSKSSAGPDSPEPVALTQNDRADTEIRFFAQHYWSTWHIAHDVEARRGAQHHSPARRDGAAWYAEQGVPESLWDQADAAFDCVNQLDDLLLELCDNADPRKTGEGLRNKRRVREARSCFAHVERVVRALLHEVRRPSSRGSQRSPAEVVVLGECAAAESNGLKQLAALLRRGNRTCLDERRRTVSNEVKSELLQFAFFDTGPLAKVWPLRDHVPPEEHREIGQEERSVSVKNAGPSGDSTSRPLDAQRKRRKGHGVRLPSALIRLVAAVRAVERLRKNIDAERPRQPGESDLLALLLAEKYERISTIGRRDHAEADALVAAWKDVLTTTWRALITASPPRGDRRTALTRKDSVVRFALDHRRHGNRWKKLGAAVVGEAADKPFDAVLRAIDETARNKRRRRAAIDRLPEKRIQLPRPNR